MASLHLIKLSVGSESPKTLADWQVGRLEREGFLYHKTRMFPRRAAELLQGGSIYWVIRGRIRCRQKLLDIRPEYRENEGPGALLILDPKLVLTNPRAHRPFQGWRYLLPEDAPKDLKNQCFDDLEGEQAMPPEMAAALEDLGLL